MYGRFGVCARNEVVNRNRKRSTKFGDTILKINVELPADNGHFRDVAVFSSLNLRKDRYRVPLLSDRVYAKVFEVAANDRYYATYYNRRYSRVECMCIYIYIPLQQKYTIIFRKILFDNIPTSDFNNFLIILNLELR